MSKDVKYQIACLTTAQVFIIFLLKELSKFTLKGKETEMSGPS